MVTVIGVRFRTAGKIYYFDPGDRKIGRGVNVIVETARGLEMGTVMLPNKEVDDEAVVQPLKPVIRIANDEDFAVIKANKEKQKEAYRICQEKIAKHELEMKLVDVEYTFDGNKILFYFTANGRIDFRELVKDLASVFKTRIELRQIGVRDETKLLGGIGICGRALCCHSYLADFVPVSIKMAKEQNLSLNPTKISGVCGRLMCCLKNEEDTYEYLNSQLPGNGDSVTIRGTEEKGTVTDVNVLRQRVKVALTDESGNIEVKEYPVTDLRFYNKKRKEMCGCEPLEEEREAAEMEALDRADMTVTEEQPRPERPRRERNENRGERRERNENREGRESRENRGERREKNENREGRESRENRGERREKNENREGRESRENRGERREKNENREGRESRENRGERRERNENREGRESRENRGERREKNENRRDRRSRNEQNESAEQQSRQNRGEGEEQSRQNGEGRGRRNRGRRGEGNEQSRQNRGENGEQQPRQSRSENGEGQPREGRSRRNRGRRGGENRQNGSAPAKNEE